MRNISILFLAAMFISSISFAQDDSDYVMFENSRFVVKTDKYMEFSKAIAHHNKTWHAKGPAHVNIWYVAVGEHSGDMIASGGPLTFTDVDNISLGKDHMEDWLKNVMPNIKYMKGTNYWKLDKKHTYNPAGEQGQSTKLSIAMYDIKYSDSYRFKAILDLVVKVYQEKKYDKSIWVYWPEFNVTKGQDVAVIWPFSNYAFFDEESTFKEDFESVNGAGSWQPFIDELRDVVDGRYDEVWELIPELSGAGE